MTRIPFDPDAIRALAAVLSETGLTEIEIADKDSRIRVVRAAAPSLVAAAPVIAVRSLTIAERTQPPLLRGMCVAVSIGANQWP